MRTTALLGIIALASALDTTRVGCGDDGPFVLDHDPPGGLWSCQADALSCYNDIASQMLDRLAKDRCPGGPCLAVSDPGYADQLRETLGRPITEQAGAALPDAGTRVPGVVSRPCPWAAWPPQMDYAANVVLQRADRCQVDAAGLAVLFEMAERLSRQEALCARFGVPGRAPDICAGGTADAGSGAGVAGGAIGRALVRLAASNPGSRDDAQSDVRTNRTPIGDAALSLGDSAPPDAQPQANTLAAKSSAQRSVGLSSPSSSSTVGASAGQSSRFT